MSERIHTGFKPLVLSAWYWKGSLGICFHLHGPTLCGDTGCIPRDDAVPVTKVWRGRRPNRVGQIQSGDFKITRWSLV